MDLDALFPGCTREEHAPTRDDLPLASFKVIHLAPAAVSQPHVYLTQGAREHGSDFVLHAPRADTWLVDVLTSAAYFQSFYGLDVGATYKVARGWLLGSSLNRLLVSARPPFEPADGYVRLLPITEDEEKFARKHGAAVLEERLAKANLVAEERASVV